MTKTLEERVADLEMRMLELEQDFYIEDEPLEIDELEAAHLEFAGLVRARREGSA